MLREGPTSDLIQNFDALANASPSRRSQAASELPISLRQNHKTGTTVTPKCLEAPSPSPIPKPPAVRRPPWNGGDAFGRVSVAPGCTTLVLLLQPPPPQHRDGALCCFCTVALQYLCNLLSPGLVRPTTMFVWCRNHGQTDRSRNARKLTFSQVDLADLPSFVKTVR